MNKAETDESSKKDIAVHHEQITSIVHYKNASGLQTMKYVSPVDKSDKIRIGVIIHFNLKFRSMN